MGERSEGGVVEWWRKKGDADGLMVCCEIKVEFVSNFLLLVAKERLLLLVARERLLLVVRGLLLVVMVRV